MSKVFCCVAAGAMALLCQAARADDLRPPPWQRFVDGTTFAHYGFDNFVANPDQMVTSPDAPDPNPKPANYLNPYPLGLAAMSTAQRMGDSPGVLFPTAKMVRSGVQLFDNGQLILRGATGRMPEQQFVQINVQMTYFFGLLPQGNLMLPFSTPRFMQFSDQAAQNYLRVDDGTQNIFLEGEDGFVHNTSTWTLIPDAANNGRGFEIRLVPFIQGDFAFIDQVVIDTVVLVPEPHSLLLLAAGLLAARPR